MLTNVLVLPLDRPQHRILLGLKKTGFGAGKYVGFGGKLEADETLAMAAVRELWEECRLSAKAHHLWYAARLEFLFPANPDWNRTVHVFRLEFWEGEPQESGEIRPQWFDLDALPLDQMWADVPYWLPQVLLGLRPLMRFTYHEDNQTVGRVEELE
jgi:8-oxo-dGTP diphosphatase